MCSLKIDIGAFNLEPWGGRWRVFGWASSGQLARPGGEPRWALFVFMGSDL